MIENPFIDPARQRFLELIDEVEERSDPTSERDLVPHRIAEPWGVDPWVSCMVEVDRELARLRDLALGEEVDDFVPESAFVNVAVGAINARILYEEAALVESNGIELDDGQMATFLEKLAKDLGERIERLRSKPEDVDPWSTPEVAKRAEEFLTDEEKEEHTGHVHWTPEDWTPVEDTDDADNYSEDAPDAVDRVGKLDQARVAGHFHYSFTSPDPGPDTQPFDVSALIASETPGPEPVPEQELPEGLPPEPSNGKPHPEGLPPEPVDLDAAERELAKGLVDLRKTAGGSGHPTIGGAHQSPADTDPDMGATGRRAKGEE